MNQIRYNTTLSPNRIIKYLVIHDTANKSNGANANSHFEYFNSENRNASADFFVDDSQVLQVNDYKKYYTWHVGDGKGKYGITNENSIGIEMCVNCDGDFEKTIINTVNLVKKLKNEFPNCEVVRHYDASRKNCPASLNYDDWKGWRLFLDKINKIEDINVALDILLEAGIINNKEYRLKVIDIIKYEKEFILNVANALQK